MQSYKSNLYVDTFVTVAFYCMYMCKNFVHSCVWQLFLKNKRWDEMKKNKVAGTVTDMHATNTPIVARDISVQP